MKRTKNIKEMDELIIEENTKSRILIDKMKIKKRDRPRHPWLGRSSRGGSQNNGFDLTPRLVTQSARLG